MLHSPSSLRRIAPVLVASAAAAFAQDLPKDLLAANEEAMPPAGVLPLDPGAAPAPAADSGVSQNVTVNLINRLVKRGVLTQEDAADLMKLAEADAAAAQTREVALQQQVESMNPGVPSDDEVRVTYVPDSVKAQMREEIKQEVLAQAREQNWAAPNEVPGWVKRFNVFGDFRLRYEGVYFPEGNDNTGAFPNFNAINTGAPFNANGVQFAPQLNVDQNRERYRLRARVGAEVDLEDGFMAGFRLATGENNSPVSTNQSMGLSNQGQGGNFSKYAIWLDRAFLKYEFQDINDISGSLQFGRFDNPFFSSPVMFDEDLGFDGFALKARRQLADGVKGFLTAGAFPIFNTDFNFSSNQPAKFDSTDKYLYGAQVGVDWKIDEDWSAKFAAAYYGFNGVEGRMSSPFFPATPQDAGDTDTTRPSFAQKGNSYMPLRTIVLPPGSPADTPIYQYYGLATPFRNLTLSGQANYDGYEPLRISLMGEFIKNLAFDEGALAANAVNNRGVDPDGAGAGVGSFDGGDTAWLLQLQVGSAALEEFGDWNTYLGYRHVESDAVVDGFTDSAFGLGGTNMKGFTIGANLAITKSVKVGARWMSADQIAGPQFKCDILQLDLNAKF